MKNFLKRKSVTRVLMGFTLIELLVVISIIAILALSAFVYFITAQAKTRDARRKSDLRQIEDALVLYQDNSNNLYPNSLGDLVPNYLPKIPQDPKTGANYSYRVFNNFYEIDANLETNIDGAADIDGGNQSFPVYEVGNDLTLLP